MKTVLKDYPPMLACPMSNCDGTAHRELVDRQVKFFCDGCNYAFDKEWHYPNKKRVTFQEALKEVGKNVSKA